MPQNTILLLQGPVGPFFDDLQSAFIEENIPNKRILFNPGDTLFSSQNKYTEKFKGNLEDWGNWIKNYFIENKINFIVLYGSDRPIHSIARKVAVQLNIKVLSLEEGYFRPGYVTIEEGGNNTSSPLAGKLPNKSFNSDPNLLGNSVQKSFYKSSFKNKCLYSLIYYLVRELFSSSGQRKLFHKHMNLFNEAKFWAKNYILWNLKRKKEIFLFQEISNYDYYIVALQMDSDMQSRFQSNGWKKLDLIKETIQSFARFSPKSSKLVFKVHPLERGHYRHFELIKSIASNIGVASRIYVIQTGGISKWLKSAKGMITINSTAGFSAIYHGCPILVLGNAIYDHRKFSYKYESESDLNGFWEKYRVYNSTIEERANYLNWIKSISCVEGDYFIKDCRNLVAKEIISRFK